MKTFFNITDSYSFEWGDFDCLTTIVNLLLIFTIGFKAAFFGLAVATFGLGKDFFNPDRRINIMLIHVSSIILNIYFLFLLLTK